MPTGTYLRPLMLTSKGKPVSSTIGKPSISVHKPIVLAGAAFDKYQNSRTPSPSLNEIQTRSQHINYPHQIGMSLTLQPNFGI